MRNFYQLGPKPLHKIKILKLNNFLALVRRQARRWVPPLNTQHLKDSTESWQRKCFRVPPAYPITSGIQREAMKKENRKLNKSKYHLHTAMHATNRNKHKSHRYFDFSFFSDTLKLLWGVIGLLEMWTDFCEFVVLLGEYQPHILFTASSHLDSTCSYVFWMWDLGEKTLPIFLRDFNSSFDLKIPMRIIILLGLN